MLSIARLYWKTNLLLTQVVQKVFPDHWLWLKFDQFLKKIVGFAFTLNIYNYIIILANIITFLSMENQMEMIDYCIFQID